MLEASYIIHLLQPHHRNFNKRIVKTPKLYFYDTGVVCRLLGIDTPAQVATHPLRGALVETWVIAELLKGRLHRADRTNLYFWRDRAGNEVDVIIEEGDRLLPIEIKSGATAASDFADSLRRWSDLAGDAAGEPYVIYGGGRTMRRSGVDFVGWRDLPASPIATARR